MLPQTSKEKSARADWGYHARRSGLARTRRWLWLAAAVLLAGPLAALTVAAMTSGQPQQQLAVAASRGPLASPHAAWESQCEACHVPFSPIGSDRWFDKLTGRTAGVSAVATKCESCHTAPAHHPAVVPGQAAGCADCHRDHQGRDHSLTRLADAACVRCHADPKALASAGSITGFGSPDGHPEFAALDAAPNRTLKFSHATHLAPSLGRAAGYTFADIGTADRERYMALLGAASPQSPVELTCAACHQLDAARTDGAPGPKSKVERFAELTRPALAGLPAEPLQPVRAAGATFLPVNFEAHCQACHPLTFDPALPDRSAPHRATVDELDRFLREVYADRFVRGEMKKQPTPDRGSGRLDPRPEATEAARGTITAAIEQAKQTLLLGRRTCLECHFADSKPPAAGDPRLPAALVRTTVRPLWLPKGRFDHTAHRAMDCRGCHPGAYRDKPSEEKAAAGEYQHRPDLPTVESCRTCHSPSGGVRHGCTDCHSYHHADRRLQGRGAPARTPAAPFPDADGWLRGRRP
ncbi:MAG: hypothetical protein U0871_26825 [Gemmataceae bacterium]